MELISITLLERYSSWQIYIYEKEIKKKTFPLDHGGPSLGGERRM